MACDCKRINAAWIWHFRSHLSLLQRRRRSQTSWAVFDHEERTKPNLLRDLSLLNSHQTRSSFPNNTIITTKALREAHLPFPPIPQLSQPINAEVRPTSGAFQLAVEHEQAESWRPGLTRRCELQSPAFFYRTLKNFMHSFFIPPFLPKAAAAAINLIVEVAAPPPKPK